MRVLVVDDSEPIRSRLLEMVRDVNGVDARWAANVAEASRAIQAEMPDLVVLDIRMPDGSGLDLLRALRADGCPATVIMLTSYASPQLRASCLAAGADYFFDKLDEFQRVAEVVTYLTDRARGGTRESGPPAFTDSAVPVRDQVLIWKLEEQRLTLERLNGELADSEARLRAVFDAEPECVKLLTADGALLDMNPAGLRMIEADSLDQVVNQSVYDLVTEERRPAFRELIASAFRGESGTLEFEIIGLKGSRRWLQTHSSPLHDAAGAVTAALGVTRDITDRLRVEAALRESEAALRIREEHYLHQRDALIALTSLTPNDGDAPMAQLRRITESAARTLGVSRISIWRFTGDGAAIECVELYETATGRHSSGLALHGADQPAYFAALRQGEVIAADDACADPRTAQLADPYLRPLGIGSLLDAPVQVGGRLAGVLCHEHTGGVRHWTQDEKVFAVALANLVSLALEGHERQRAETELREAQERLKLAVRAGKVGLWDWNLQTNEVRFSPEWKLQIGYRDEEISSDLGEWQSRVHSDDLARAMSVQQSCISGGLAAFEVEFRLRHKDGSYRHILSRGSNILDDEGVPVRLVGAHVDITDWTELQAQFLQAQKMDSVGQLAGGIAHDFNNLLTVINGVAELILSDINPGDPLHKDLREIREAGNRAAALTRQLLVFSRKQVLSPAVLDLNAVILGIQPMLRRLISEHIELVFAPAAELSAVKADKGQIEQVIMNLVVNARDAMPNGGTLCLETSEIEVDEAYASEHPSMIPGPHVMIAVSDTGIGMDKETLQRMFEPFFTTKGPSRGTGLGLSTVYGIVKQSGGSIWAYSEPGRGTAFKIYLPRAAEGERSVRATPVEAHPRGTETVLVVEDDASVRDLTTRFLMSTGYTVIKAADGAQALMALEAHRDPVHLMITDVVMPGMTGRELAEHFASRQPQMRIIYTSGYTDDMILRHGVIERGTHFIGKPYTMTDLGRKVRKVLDLDSKANG